MPFLLIFNWIFRRRVLALNVHHVSVVIKRSFFKTYNGIWLMRSISLSNLNCPHYTWRLFLPNGLNHIKSNAPKTCEILHNQHLIPIRYVSQHYSERRIMGLSPVLGISSSWLCFSNAIAASNSAEILVNLGLPSSNARSALKSSLLASICTIMCLLFTKYGPKR